MANVARRMEKLCVFLSRLAEVKSIASGIEQKVRQQMEKNQREWEEFGMTRFSADAFFETVPFQRLEIEYIDPDAPKKKNRDYRNAFD